MVLNIGHCLVELIFVSMGPHELLDLKCHPIEAILVNKDQSTLPTPWEYRAEVLNSPTPPQGVPCSGLRS